MPASRSLIALLIGTVAFFALWLFALKGGSNSSTGGSGTSKPALGQFQSDINKAHQAVGISNSSNAASGNDGTASSSPSPAPASTASTATHSARSASRTATAAANNPRGAAARNRMSTVQRAVTAHRVVAMLFYNPAAADDRAVKQELASIPTRKGKVVKLTIPLSEAANYTAVTQQVPVNFSPTLVLIAHNGQAGEIQGYSDRFEIAQRVDDALAAK